ncbi:MAG TPA: DUF5615 family PIN-like protein [Thermoanaerobaculia bacterium]|nr:DUF5615 family PIN-like protein [Thermoanaerobaculia bacterium]
MLSLAADHNFNARILRGLRRRLPEVDVVTLLQVALDRAEDPDVLEWSASEGRPLLTHDVSTLTRYAWDRVREGRAMPGVIAVASEEPIGPVIEDLVLVVAASEPGDLEGQVIYLPL